MFVDSLPSFPFILPVWGGQVNTELTLESFCYSYFPGNLDLLHFVNLFLTEYLRKKIAYYKKTNPPVFHQK